MVRIEDQSLVRVTEMREGEYPVNRVATWVSRA